LQYPTPGPSLPSKGRGAAWRGILVGRKPLKQPSAIPCGHVETHKLDTITPLLKVEKLQQLINIDKNAPTFGNDNLVVFI